MKRKYIGLIMIISVLVLTATGVFATEAGVNSNETDIYDLSNYEVKDFVYDDVYFKDIPFGHWATQYIYEAQEKGVINGYPDGTFLPENNVAVGEFIKMVATTYFENYEYVAPTDGSHWAMPYVNSLHRVVLNADNYDYATLERTITRAEAARLLCVLHYKTHNVELDKSYSSVSNFADADQITDATDKLAIDNCVKFGLINGHAEDNTFRPLEGLTRCQAAKILMLTITR